MDISKIKTFIEAAKQGNLDFVKHAIKDGMPVDAVINLHDKTALGAACSSNHYGVAEYLLSKGANPKHQDDNNNHPLIYAAYRGHKNIVLLLLQNGADKNLIGDYGSASNWACKEGHPGVATLVDTYIPVGWKKTADEQIEHCYTENDNTRQITDVFNFFVRERTRYATINAASQIAMTVTPFKDIHPPVLQEAFNELTARGGTPNPKSLTYRTISRRKNNQ